MAAVEATPGLAVTGIVPRPVDPAPLAISVVVPTFNERPNVRPLIDAVAAALAGEAFEIIFVDDDSPDGTADAAWAIARVDPRVRCLKRVGRRGLSGACVEGILASAAPYVAVIDGDLQHDERLLPGMLATLRSGAVDLVIGSRYVAGSGLDGLSPMRRWISRLGLRLSRAVVRAPVADPLSGFFMLRREAFDAAAPNLSILGFKILLDLFASSPKPLRFTELAFRFRARQEGASKLDAMVAWEFLLLLLAKLTRNLLPIRFIVFSIVGTLGVLVHTGVLYAALRVAGAPFVAAQAAATGVAMTSNFFLNNALTYRDRRLAGRKLVRGLLTFYAVCAVGALANLEVADAVWRELGLWWAAGLAGAVMGAVWNYAASSIFTWRHR